MFLNKYNKTRERSTNLTSKWLGRNFAQVACTVKLHGGDCKEQNSVSSKLQTYDIDVILMAQTY